MNRLYNGGNLVPYSESSCNNDRVTAQNFISQQQKKVATQYKTPFKISKEKLSIRKKHLIKKLKN